MMTSNPQDVLHLAESNVPNPYSLRSGDVYRLDVKVGPPNEDSSILQFLRSKHCADASQADDIDQNSALKFSAATRPLDSSVSTPQPQPLGQQQSQQSKTSQPRQYLQAVTPTQSPAQPRIPKLLHAQSATISRSASLPSTCLFPPQSTGEKKGVPQQDGSSNSTASPTPSTKRRTASAIYSCSRCQRQMSVPMFTQEDGLKTTTFCSFACFNSKSPR